MDYQNIGKDRSLGIVDLKLSDYIEETGDQAYPYRSKGSRQMQEKIKLDKGNHYKGTLHFEIDFKPAMSLRGGVSFEAKKNELEIAAEEKDSDTSSLSSSDEGNEKVGHNANHARQHSAASGSAVRGHGHARKLSEQFSTAPVPVQKGHGTMGSVDRTSIAPSVARTVDSKADMEKTEVEKVEKGVVMSQEDLLSHRMFKFPHFD
jgi:hypothetical protein